MDGHFADPRTMTVEELTNVVSLFPWFASARKELAARSGRLEDAALYVCSRKTLSDLSLAGSGTPDYTDKDVDKLLSEARKVRAVGGDFFSQDEYDQVRIDSDSVLPKFGMQTSERSDSSGDDTFMHFCTETLAKIYADQGYYDQAKYIYSKLILRYPEKSAYFASLIEKMGTDN